MNYRSIDDMNRTILHGLHLLPKDLDLIVGVPRSGLLAGLLLSLLINAPLVDIDGYCAGRMLAVGKTRRRPQRCEAESRKRRVVVIDDSIFHGSAMREARQKIRDAGLDDDVTFVACYGNSTRHLDADIVFEAVGQPRFFQWNVMHHAILRDSCLDIDGILCLDPREEENDDGPNYEIFLQDARPLAIPTRTVGTLVTSRLEKYRAQTEAWMKRWDVEYDELIMLDLPDMETRRKSRAHGSFKGSVYARSNALLFIESEHHQALQIAETSGKPVLCMHCNNLIEPGKGDLLALSQRIRSMPRRFMLSKTSLTSKGSTKLLIRRLLGDDRVDRIKQMLRG